MPEPLTAAQVEHVAKLARLRLSPEQVERYRSQLSAVLEHIAKLGELEVGDVEPMAHAFEMTNRLDDDVPGAAMPTSDLLRNAPAVEGPFLAVPKVLDEGGGA
ncbi:MAG: Asp-tRNA(Asn)/Glu-tRNA(Gln) amidotransferase subunit GatC [Phycisphaerales bacterium]